MAVVDCESNDRRNVVFRAYFRPQASEKYLQLRRRHLQGVAGFQPRIAVIVGTLLNASAEMCADPRALRRAELDMAPKACGVPGYQTGEQRAILDKPDDDDGLYWIAHLVTFMLP